MHIFLECAILCESSGFFSKRQTIAAAPHLRRWKGGSQPGAVLLCAQSFFCFFSFPNFFVCFSLWCIFNGMHNPFNDSHLGIFQSYATDLVLPLWSGLWDTEHRYTIYIQYIYNTYTIHIYIYITIKPS